MNELIPFKKPGDLLYAKEINLLSGAARTAGTRREGGGQFGLRGWFNATAGEQAHIEVLMICEGCVAWVVGMKCLRRL